MANYKVGLDYFELDCQLEEKIRLIQAEFGLKGFAVIVKLYQKIYGECGYYCEWKDDSLLLFMSENGLPSDNKNLISEIISACIRRNIFSEDLFKRYGILTSHGIQKRYLKATSKRDKIEMKKEYLLVSVDKIKDNVVIISHSDGIISHSDGIIEQSRVEESKEKKSKEHNKQFVPPSVEEVGEYCRERKNNIDPQAFVDFYAAKGWMIGKNKMKDWKACVRTWEKNRSEKSSKNNSNVGFNDFHQRQYDFDALEKQLLNQQDEKT